MQNLESLSLPPISKFPAKTNGHDPTSSTSSSSSSNCHGLLHDAVLIVPSALFVLFLGYHAKKNLKKLYHGRSYIMIAHYALLWSASLLNLAWCFLQAWECSPGKEVAWNLLSLVTTSGILCLEISLLAFLLQENYTSGRETLARTFMFSGIIVGVDALLKASWGQIPVLSDAIFVFGFGVPLFIDSDYTTHKSKWGVWIIHKLLLAAIYGFILFVHFSKWREKLPPRPAFYNYIIVMFVINAVALFSCGLAGSGAGFGLWLFNFTVICYHSLYLPFLYVTFLADFFQEEDFLLDNAYYSEMKDAGFFDADWD